MRSPNAVDLQRVGTGEWVERGGVRCGQVDGLREEGGGVDRWMG